MEAIDCNGGMLEDGFYLAIKYLKSLKIKAVILRVF